MARELSNASPFKDNNRRGRVRTSESLSSTYANPALSPYNSRDTSPVPSDTRATGQLTADNSNLSLSVNYLPSKFSSGVLAGGGGGGGETRRRPVTRDRDDFIGSSVPKMGGGIDAFKSGEARMGGEGDGDEDDDDDDDGGSGKKWFMRGRKAGDTQGLHKKLWWNKFKWILFAANATLTTYSFIALIFCLMTWFNIWAKADIIRVGNRPELIISTLAASIGIFTALIGWAGILMNNRSFLAVYTFLLWITFAFLVMPGYITYKRRTFNLEGKINAQWSRLIGPEGRVRIQNQLECCGYYNPFIEATISQSCYARSILPGCKLGYLTFERRVLKRWYTVSFGLVPFHLLIMTAGLLCSNHVTYRFGKGMMPKAYRLSMTSMAIIMDNYASQLAEQYGTNVATDGLSRSRSNIQLDSMPYTSLTSTKPPPVGHATKYDSVNTRPSPNDT
ncbi:hypothetical protein BYT27DRAFT_7111548 [Phlegmacium glaucopus]|nr:hypothetical protein BYT27DRAFT_7111548 [Phlegmacium glaucopus]